MFNPANLLQDGAKKFRENSADSVLFHLNQHTPALPRTLTSTRELPKPRKGNLGTNKTFLNFRIMRNIATTGEADKLVPQIVKIETSNPVGITEDDMAEILVEVVRFIGSNATYRPTQVQMYINGELLEVLPEVPDVV
jgi:hypothetical protein